MDFIRTAAAAVAVLAAGALAAAPADASFAGSNGAIAFDGFGADGELDIFAMRPNGHGAVNLTNTPGADQQPAWSPDGDRIAFASNRDGDFEVFVMRADGTRVRQLTHGAGAEEFDPTWSPDGRHLAFVAYADGDTDIHTMRADGTRRVNVTNSPDWDLEPNWSPTAPVIAFQSDRDPHAGTPEIYAVAAGGGPPVRLTFLTGLEPNWSPDGRHIAFDSYRDGNGEIYRMRADGSRQARLTDDPADDIRPVWSPDGRQIAFDRMIGPDLYELFRMKSDGGKARDMARGSALEFAPDWQAATSHDQDKED